MPPKKDDQPKGYYGFDSTGLEKAATVFKVSLKQLGCQVP